MFFNRHEVYLIDLYMIPAVARRSGVRLALVLQQGRRRLAQLRRTETGQTRGIRQDCDSRHEYMSARVRAARYSATGEVGRLDVQLLVLPNARS